MSIILQLKYNLQFFKDVYLCRFSQWLKFSLNSKSLSEIRFPPWSYFCFTFWQGKDLILSLVRKVQFLNLFLEENINFGIWFVNKGTSPTEPCFIGLAFLPIRNTVGLFPFDLAQKYILHCTHASHEIIE